MSDTDELVTDERATHDNLHNPGSSRRRVAYIASLEYVQKCDCLPKVKGRVVYTDVTELEPDLLILFLLKLIT